MKKLLITIMTLVLFVFATPVSATQLFADVNDKTKGFTELNYLVKQGYIKANTAQNYGIHKKASRYDVAYLLALTLQLELPTNITASPFKDIDSTDKRLPYILAVSEAKLMSGNADGNYYPNKEITRAQLSNILVKAYKLNGTSTHIFADVPKNHSAYKAVSVMVANQITSGFENNEFRPNVLVTKGQVAIFIARILNPKLRKPLNIPKSCVVETKQSKYYVNVSVANLWHNYNVDRSIDQPSITNPVNYDKWIGSMNLQQKKWLVGRTDTQALFYDEVTLIKSRGDMHYVAAKDQYVPYNKNGYPGWLGKNQIVKSNLNTTKCEIAVVTATKTTLYNEKNKQPFLQISYATILPVVKKENGYYHVQTPANGIKLLKINAAKVYKNYNAIPKPSQADIVNTAKRYIGLPYLWAGTSAWGYDCSGIIYAAYRAHGIMIPRDSFYQATKGSSVSKSKLQPGDLVFFAYNGGKGKIYHVGLYIGNGQMLHAPNYASKVRIDPLNSGVYKRNYAGAKRYL